ncbi:MAG: hypothetical protein GX294_08660 [Candidatus Cloacimonetes bacterium]|nr:hypothetical protein [Candidatus Cloacimonadota bacterium]
MKSKQVLFVLLAILLLVAFSACGKNKTRVSHVEGEVIHFPSWWNTQKDDAYVCTYGIGTNVKLSTSIDTAKNSALFEAAQYVETEVMGMLKTYEEEAGVFDPQLLALTQKVIKTVSNATFSGVINGQMESRQVTEYGGPRVTTYLQLKIPKTEVKKQLYNNIRNEEALYNQFKASMAFDELERTVGH